MQGKRESGGRGIVGLHCNGPAEAGGYMLPVFPGGNIPGVQV